MAEGVAEGVGRGTAATVKASAARRPSLELRPDCQRRVVQQQQQNPLQQAAVAAEAELLPRWQP